MIVDITGLSYDVTTLPTLTQCVLRVVAYSDHCPLNPNGGTATTTGTFTTGEAVGYMHALSSTILAVIMALSIIIPAMLLVCGVKTGI